MYACEFFRFLHGVGEYLSSAQGRERAFFAEWHTMHVQISLNRFANFGACPKNIPSFKDRKILYFVLSYHFQRFGCNLMINTNKLQPSNLECNAVICFRYGLWNASKLHFDRTRVVFRTMTSVLGKMVFCSSALDFLCGVPCVMSVARYVCKMGEGRGEGRERYYYRRFVCCIQFFFCKVSADLRNLQL